MFKPIKHLIRFGDLSLTNFRKILNFPDYVTTDERTSIREHLEDLNRPIMFDYQSDRGRSRLSVSRAKLSDGLGPSRIVMKVDLSICANQSVRMLSVATTDFKELPEISKVEVQILKDEEWISLKCQIDIERSDSGRSFFVIRFNVFLSANSEQKFRLSFNKLPYQYASLFVNSTENAKTTFELEGVEFKVKLDPSELTCFKSFTFHPALD